MTDYERLTRYMQVGNKVEQIIPQRKERIQAYIDRLFDLEDKIESGELISKKEVERLQAENAVLRERLEKAVELPLECGSIVWYLNTQPSISLKANTVYEGKLMRYHLSVIGGKVYFIADIQIKNDYGVTELPEVEKDFGKIWFTTREAAEARLAKLKGETK